MMKTLPFIAWFIMAVSVLALGLEVSLCKRKAKFAFILPFAVACCSVFLGFYSIILSGLMFLIYYAMHAVIKQMEKEKRAKHWQSRENIARC